MKYSLNEYAKWCPWWTCNVMDCIPPGLKSRLMNIGVASQWTALWNTPEEYSSHVQKANFFFPSYLTAQSSNWDLYWTKKNLKTIKHKKMLNWVRLPARMSLSEIYTLVLFGDTQLWKNRVWKQSGADSEVSPIKGDTKFFVSTYLQ